MNIYLADTLPVEVPAGFEAVSITLDAGLKSLLEWGKELLEADRLKKNGFKLFWNLDFDLQLTCTEAQVSSLRLAVEHFCSAVWEKFREETAGVCLYLGGDLLNDEQIRVLEILAGGLPDEVEAFIMLDVSSLSSPTEISRAISKERFPHFTLVVKGVENPLPEFGWESVCGSRGMIGRHLVKNAIVEPTIGLCIPEKGASSSLDEIALWLKSKDLPFRMIPETLLTSEWQGLDDVIVDSETVASLCKRRLMGFCAAGGTIVTIGKPLGLPIEVSCEEWKDSLCLKQDLSKSRLLS